MMLITNGKKIVMPGQDIDVFKDTISDIAKRAKDMLGFKGKSKDFFVLNEEGKFPFYEIKIDISLTQLREIAGEEADVHYRAIGEEQIKLQRTSIRDIEHKYTEDELKNIADEMARAIDEKEDLEEEKKKQAAHYSELMKQADARISKLASKYRMKHETRSMELEVTLDFSAGVRVYSDTVTKEVAHTEPLERSDYQMKFDYVDGFWNTQGTVVDEGTELHEPESLEDLEGDQPDEPEYLEDENENPYEAPFN